MTSCNEHSVTKSVRFYQDFLFHILLFLVIKTILTSLFAVTFETTCTTFYRYPIFSTRYSVMCKVYTSYCGTSEIEHGLCACTVDNPLAKARGLSLRTGAQPMLYLPLNARIILTQMLSKSIQRLLRHCLIVSQIEIGRLLLFLSNVVLCGLSSGIAYAG